MQQLINNLFAPNIQLNVISSSFYEFITEGFGVGYETYLVGGGTLVGVGQSVRDDGVADYQGDPEVVEGCVFL